MPIDHEPNNPDPSIKATPLILTSNATTAEGMHPLLAKQPRYCLACGKRLELPHGKGGRAACGHCLNPFDPADPSTFLPVPPPDPYRWWHTKEVPGLTFLLLYVLGSLVIGSLISQWGVNATGAGNRERVVDAASAIIAVFLILFGLAPWLFACAYLLLVALEHHLRDQIVIYLTVGAIAGAVCAAGYHPALLLVGGILGTLAGFIRQARMNLD
ncbi:MAG: hypothetical protein AAF328_08840 [Planctomycetota bacterium]